MAHINPNFQTFEEGQPHEVTFKPFCEEAELDEQWSFVGKNQTSARLA